MVMVTSVHRYRSQLSLLLVVHRNSSRKKTDDDDDDESLIYTVDASTASEQIMMLGEVMETKSDSEFRGFKLPVNHVVIRGRYVTGGAKDFHCEHNADDKHACLRQLQVHENSPKQFQTVTKQVSMVTRQLQIKLHTHKLNYTRTHTAAAHRANINSPTSIQFPLTHFAIDRARSNINSIANPNRLCLCTC